MSCVIQNTKGCTIYELRTDELLPYQTIIIIIIIIIIIRKTERGEQ